MDSGDPAVPGPAAGSVAEGGHRKSFRNVVNDKHKYLGGPLSKLGCRHPSFGIDILRRYIWIVRKGSSNKKYLY